MKETLKTLVLVFTLAFALGLSSCNPCEDVSCQHGGSCVKGDCECPPNYWGAFCGEEKTPTKVLIQSVIVGGFKSTNQNGLPWDLTSNPDVYLEFYQDNAFLGVSNSLENEDPGRTRTFSGGNLPIELNPLKLVQIRVMDYDTPNDRELIFFEYLSPYTRGRDFPTQIVGAGMSINVTYVHE